MVQVYRGKVMSALEAAAVKARMERKKRAARIRLIRILALCIVFAALATRIMISAASYSKVKSRALGEKATAVTLSNRIGSVQYEIERELRADNLTYKAAATLGMVEPGSGSTVYVDVARAN